MGRSGNGNSGAPGPVDHGMEFGITTFNTDEGMRPDRLAAAVEERGFDSLFVSEHSHIPASRDSPSPGGGELPRMYYRTLDPFVSLTAAAGATSTLRLGTGIALLAQRDPIHAAKQVASLDWLSGGRVLFGVGVGWNREEMRQHGTDPRTRGRLLDEQLELMRTFWTQEQAEFHGEFHDIAPSYAWPKPIQDPHPPILVGGNSPSALQRAARHGGTWLPNAVPQADRIEQQLAMLSEHTTERPAVRANGLGRDPEILAGYAAAGVERVTLALPTKPEDETLRRLDELAELKRRFA